MFNFLRLFGREKAAKPIKASMIKASYDASKKTTENQRYWTNVDYLSPDASASYEVRRDLRARSRYEMQENNSIGKGMMLTLANDVVGTGPRLQMTTDDSDFNRILEEKFSEWMKVARLSEKLRTAVLSKKVDGEIFIWKTTNRNIRTAVTLDPKLIEGDQVTTPVQELLFSDNQVDGIVYDDYGNPIEYHVLRYHPGSQNVMMWTEPMKVDKVPADEMIHLFREDRPGQRRGIPEVASALPLFGMLRRYTLAVIAAAETAADFAGVMYSDSPAVDPDDVEPMDAIELEMRAMLTLPKGWKLGQMKAEQPVDTYEMFKKLIIQEIARCINMPYNIAAGDSSEYNYASGRLDHQTYFRSITIERRVLETVVLDELFASWLDEALLIDGYLPPVPAGSFSWSWQWDGFEHVDPEKEANASVVLVQAGLMTHSEYHSSKGRDWVEVFEQRAKEQQLAEDLNLETTDGDQNQEAPAQGQEEDQPQED